MLWVHIIFGGLGKTQASTFGMACKTSHACIAESGMHYILEHVYLIEGWRIAPPNKYDSNLVKITDFTTNIIY